MKKTCIHEGRGQKPQSSWNPFVEELRDQTGLITLEFGNVPSKPKRLEPVHRN